MVCFGGAGAWPWEEKQRKAEKYLPCHVAHCHLDLAVMGEGVSEADLLIYQLWNVLTRKQVKTHPSWMVGRQFAIQINIVPIL